jgi:hypothetical protein
MISIALDDSRKDVSIAFDDSRKYKNKKFQNVSFLHPKFLPKLLID